MMIVKRTFCEQPGEFHASIDNGVLLHVEWRDDIENVNGMFTAVCRFLLVNEKAEYNTIVSRLVSCKYSADEEVAIMRKPDGDPEKEEHEKFVEEVKKFASLASKGV